MRSRTEKKQAKKQEAQKKAYSSTVNDIISKIRDASEATDKKLEELSRFCLDKNCEKASNG